MGRYKSEKMAGEMGVEKNELIDKERKEVKRLSLGTIRIWGQSFYQMLFN
jgi:hypothetical protein